MKPARSRTAIALITTIGLMTLAGQASAQIVTGFENGFEDWSVSGRQTIAPTGGNPDANLVGILSSFAFDVRNNTNAALLGDLTRIPSIRLTIDVKVNSINFFFSPVTRDLIVELRDNTNNNGLPYTSVYFVLDTLSASRPGWMTLSVVIEDTSAEDLPRGWRGTGAEDPVTFEPILEPGRTFASVLASVDSINFTTAVPGFFFGSTDFDIQIDNVGFEIEQTCYPDCDTSTGVGVLDLFDFLCFQGSFVSGQPYACDCDTSSGLLVCDLFDFLCFQNAFVAGCP